MASKARIGFLGILTLLVIVWVSCSKQDTGTIKVTITKILSLDSLGSPYCQFTYQPLDTTHHVKSNNILLDKCGKYTVGEVVAIPDYHFVNP